MIIKVVQKTRHELPEYATKRSAGADVRAHLAGPGKVSLHAGQRAVIPTGLFVEIPDGYEIQVRPRSGLAAKHGITVLNSPGTIDGDYRGEIGVILINNGEHTFDISDGDRIGQLVLTKVEQIEWQQVESVEDTERGTGGFGSSGVK